MNGLIAEIRQLVCFARQAVVHSVDLIQVLTNFEIGRRIVEHEQQGAERAEYGKALAEGNFCRIVGGVWKGVFTIQSRKYAQLLSGLSKIGLPRLSQTMTGKLMVERKCQMPSGILLPRHEKPGTLWQIAITFSIELVAIRLSDRNR